MVESKAAAALATREIYVREFDDPDAYTVANGLLSGQVIGRPGRNFHGRVTRLDLGRVKLRKGQATVPVTMAGGIAPLHAFTFATAPCAPRLLCGREAPFQTMLHLRPNDVMYGNSPSGTPWPFGTVALSYETMAAYGPALAGYEVAPRRDDTTLFQLNPRDLNRLVGLMVDAERLAMEQPDTARHPAASLALSGAILDALVGCLVHGEAQPDRAATRHYARVIARLEQVLAERPEEMLSLADICAAVGAAERTLHHACHEFLGVGAMQYARLRRMDRVHALLQMGDPSRDTVADIAMRYGFWELGRFAGVYRARYGETPSVTLRGRRGQRLH